MVRVASFLVVIQLALAAVPADARVGPPTNPGLFGSTEFVNHAPPQWLAALQRLRRERAVFDVCAADAAACPSDQALAWLGKLEELRSRPMRERLSAVNTLINKSAYRSDFNNFRRLDHWASPLEFIARSGDCEDYVIFKFFSLELLGFDGDHLRVVLVRDIKHNADHAVLAVDLDGETFILDNNAAEVLPHRQVSHFIPVLSFGRKGSWGHVPRQASR